MKLRELYKRAYKASDAWANRIAPNAFGTIMRAVDPSGAIRGAYEEYKNPSMRIGPVGIPNMPLGLARGYIRGIKDPSYSAGDVVSGGLSKYGVNPYVAGLAGLTTEVLIPGPGGDAKAVSKLDDVSDASRLVNRADDIKRVTNLDPVQEVAQPDNIKKMINKMRENVTSDSSKELSRLNKSLLDKPDIEKTIDNVLSGDFTDDVAEGVGKNLLEEAKKYKSAEEFIKGQGSMKVKGWVKSKTGLDMVNGDLMSNGKKVGELNIKEGDTINLSNIRIIEKGTGEGTNIVNALKEYSNVTGKSLRIDKAYNRSFWSKFGFTDVGNGDYLRYKPDYSGGKAQLTDIYNKAKGGK